MFSYTQDQMAGRIVLDSTLRKLPSSRKCYRVYLIVPDNGIPIIEYHQTFLRSTSKKPRKSIQFVDLLFADKKHDTSEKFAFSIYTIDKTITFLAQDETTMNEWLTKVRECHSNLYPEFKRYDAVFEANLLDKGLAKTMNIQGFYRLALCKDSLDLIPLLIAPHLLSKQQQSFNISTTNTTHHHQQYQHNETILPNTHHVHSTINSLNLNTAISPHSNHHHLPQHLPHHQRFHKRHPLLSSKTIELMLRSIRRCGHTDCNFYIESGRHSQIGEGDLWMALAKKSTARQLHELLLATMSLASTADDQYLHKAPRSRSGSSSENAHRAQQSRSSSLICLVADSPNATSVIHSNNHNLPNSQPAVTTTNNISTIPMLSNNNNNFDEDSGYLPMA